MTDHTIALPGKEECPGHMLWSAFGASYPDTVCSTALDWSEVEGGMPGIQLCDADDDFRPKGDPCPFHDWNGFLQAEFHVDDGETVVLWASDETPVAAGTEIHFHDGEALWWTATHPDRGEERVLMRAVPYEVVPA